MDPLVDGGLFEAPVRADLEAGQLAARGVLVDGQGLHAKVARELLDRENSVFPFQGTLSGGTFPPILFYLCYRAAVFSFGKFQRLLSLHAGLFFVNALLTRLCIFMHFYM